MTTGLHYGMLNRTDNRMVTDDNRTPSWLRIYRSPSWLRMTTGLRIIMVTDDNRTHIMVTDDNRTPLWLWMTTGLHHGYG